MLFRQIVGSVIVAVDTLADRTRNGGSNRVSLLLRRRHAARPGDFNHDSLLLLITDFIKNERAAAWQETSAATSR